MELLDRELPNAEDAERAVLGAAILDPQKALEVSANLSSGDFYNALHRAIFRAMSDLVKGGQQVDPIVLAQLLRDEHKIADPMTTIANLNYGMPHISNLSSAIKVIKEKSALRRIMKLGDKVVARANDAGEQPFEIAQAASTAFDDLAREVSENNPPFITSYSDFIEQTFDDGEVIGFHSRRGELSLVQSITGKGKSSLMRNVASSLAIGAGFAPIVEAGIPRRVLLFNFEGAGSRFQEDLQKMTEKFTHSQMELVRENLFPVHAPIVNGEPFTLSQHVPLLIQQASRIHPDVIIIDTAAAAFNIHNENDNAEWQAIAKTLIRIARKLNCLVILVHHIGKARAEEGKVKEPAHRGRGASALADFAATIFNLEG